MDCKDFEEALSDFCDGFLAPEEARLFRSHALQCRDCRALMDDVKESIQACSRKFEWYPSPLLEANLVAIPEEYADLSCNQFEGLITEFLDGFVPAQTYHLFEEHAEKCQECSALLTGVVYAVAACHSVHTFEEVDAPASLVHRLTGLMPKRKRALIAKIADALAGYAERIVPRTTQTRRWTFATAASLAFATFAFLLLGFSDDGTFSGVYRQAHVRASELYTRSTDIYTETDKVVARLERVGRGLGEFWDTLGGEPGPENSGSRRQEPRPDKQVRSTERN